MVHKLVWPVTTILNILEQQQFVSSPFTTCIIPSLDWSHQTKGSVYLKLTFERVAETCLYRITCYWLHNPAKKLAFIRVFRVHSKPNIWQLGSNSSVVFQNRLEKTLIMGSCQDSPTSNSSWHNDLSEYLFNPGDTAPNTQTMTMAL